MLCSPELAALKAAAPECVRDVIHVVEEGQPPQHGFQGRITSAVFDATSLPGSSDDHHVVVCGPPLFNKAMLELLAARGFTDEHVTVL